MTGKSFRKIVITAVLAFTITAAASFTVMAGVMGSGSKSTAKSDNETAVSIVTEAEAQAGGTTADENISATTLNTVSGGALDTSDIFTERDLEQSADLSSAQTFTVTDGQNIEITSDFQIEFKEDKTYEELEEIADYIYGYPFISNITLNTVTSIGYDVVED